MMLNRLLIIYIKEKVVAPAEKASLLGSQEPRSEALSLVASSVMSSLSLVCLVSLSLCAILLYKRI